MQYLGLLLYIVAEAIIFVPLMFVAANFSGGDVIAKAGIVTLGLFLGMTAVVFLTRKDIFLPRSDFDDRRICSTRVYRLGYHFRF